MTEPEPNEREQKEEVLGPHWNPASFLYGVLSCSSRVGLFVTLWTVPCQGPLSTAFSRQEYWTGLPFPPLGDLPDPGIKPTSLTSPVFPGGFFTTGSTWGAPALRQSLIKLG